MFLAYQFTPSEDPTTLAKLLWKHKIAHQIVQNQGRNELWLVDAESIEQAQRLLNLWKEGMDLSMTEASLGYLDEKSTSNNTTPISIMDQLKITPVTAFILLISAVLAVITQLGDDLSMIRYFTITPFEIENNQIYFYSLSNVLERQEYWRLFTPTFLHFSIMHIVFNSLWIWDIGRKLEMGLKPLIYGIGVLLIAVISNIFQYEVDQYPLFGGLSGVVYGVIGFAWFCPLLDKAWPTLISKQLMAFFVVWLVIGFTSIPQAIGLGAIANTAHLIGLLVGLCLAAIYGLVVRIRTK